MTDQTMSLPTWHSGVPKNVRIPTFIGFLIIFTAVFGFGLWAATAPLQSAIVAPGIYVATGQNKVIQHLEGGIIQDIMVREGDRVKAGQTLLLLSETRANANLQRLVIRFAQNEAALNRLRAEAAFESSVEFSKALEDFKSLPGIDAIIKNQSAMFLARKNRLDSELQMYGRSLAAYEKQITGTQAQLAAVSEQLSFTREELDLKQALVDKGLIRKSDVLSLQRGQARLQGEVGRLNSEIGHFTELKTRIDRQVVASKNAYALEAVENLERVETEIKDIRERINAAKDVLERVAIKAPVDGIVVKLNYHTPGGVVEPGKEIVELLPLRDDLIIEAHIRSQDIDNVKLGPDAMIRLTALNRRVKPMIPGKVVYISADRLPENEGYVASKDVYLARVELDAKSAQTAGFHPTPGMPTEVYITTGERTFKTYLFQPVIDSMQRAFKEQ